MTPAPSLFDLTGRVAIVTGGNGGIGLGMAKGLARAGAKVMIAARNPEKSAAAVAELAALGGEVAAVAVEMADAKSVAAMVATTLARFERLDILVANAGVNVRRQPQDFALSEWQHVIDVNLTGPFLCAQAAYPAMKAAGGGKVILIGSMASKFGLPYTAAYCASKGGVVQLAQALATAWGKDNIQINAVLPGWIDTAMTQAARGQVDGLYERVLARTPVARWGDPADFEGIATFLASRASDFVTGTAIPIDGGYSAQGV